MCYLGFCLSKFKGKKLFLFCFGIDFHLEILCDCPQSLCSFVKKEENVQFIDTKQCYELIGLRVATQKEREFIVIFPQQKGLNLRAFMPPNHD